MHFGWWSNFDRHFFDGINTGHKKVHNFNCFYSTKLYIAKSKKSEKPENTQ